MHVIGGLLGAAIGTALFCYGFHTGLPPCVKPPRIGSALTQFQAPICIGATNVFGGKLQPAWLVAPIAGLIGAGAADLFKEYVLG